MLDDLRVIWTAHDGGGGVGEGGIGLGDGGGSGIGGSGGGSGIGGGLGDGGIGGRGGGRGGGEHIQGSLNASIHGPANVITSGNTAIPLLGHTVIEFSLLRV